MRISHSSAGSTEPSVPSNQRQVQVGRGEALVDPADVLRLAQLLAAPHPQLAAQRCGSLVTSPQLLLLRLRRRPQLLLLHCARSRASFLKQFDENERSTTRTARSPES